MVPVSHTAMGTSSTERLLHSAPTVCGVWCSAVSPLSGMLSTVYCRAASVQLGCVLLLVRFTGRGICHGKDSHPGSAQPHNRQGRYLP
jgi:hypothetical protein